MPRRPGPGGVFDHAENGTPPGRRARGRLRPRPRLQHADADVLARPCGSFELRRQPVTE
ncbi:hypothetical protein [Streptomyces minutiscleroticus]|uniref:hypothetical protein n=1 Tax=Streptomyces minutiscleroticus TaxID=68238 RepID=UPI00167DB6EA|nr:hypothetical protein [Streptomyces minutiscleroticus]